MKKYQFYGWEQADVPATSKTYEKIKKKNYMIYYQKFGVRIPVHRE